LKTLLPADLSLRGVARDLGVAPIAPEASRGGGARRAVREPSRFALLYGTPVLGYQAPGEQTVGPGTRVVFALGKPAGDAWRTGKLRKVHATLSPPVRADVERLRRQFGLEMPASNVARVHGLWPAVTGAILFDAFGQYAARRTR
jgi:hypothetical protein